MVASAQNCKNVAAYQPEIDGLRAIAVTLVVLFHVGLPGFSGGFVGVDIFFVISGYLITGLLVRELLDTGRIDIIDFYARRVRRILPAFTIVLLATLAAAPVFLTVAGEQQSLASSAAAAAAFASNVYFWRTQTGYFAGPAEQLPLLHTWTLAVEEQFYIIWPVVILMLAFVARWFKASARKTMTPVFILACGGSLLACIMVTPIRESMAFYLMPFRIWEFGIGALLSILLPGRSWHSRGPIIGCMAILTGLIAIAASVLMFDKNTIFPGYAAILPGAGTALLLTGFSVAPRGSWLLTPFQSVSFVAIGKLSYSWYLWHWPLLALARAHAMGDRDIIRDLGLVILALVLSALTYVLIEQPIRTKYPAPHLKRGYAVFGGGLMLVIIAASSFVLRWSADTDIANNPEARAASHAASEKFSYPAQCSIFQLPFERLPPVSGCTVGSPGQPRALLWGDSHAFHFVPAFDLLARQVGLTVLPRAMGDCRPYVLEDDAHKGSAKNQQLRSCERFNESILASLPDLKQRGVDIVILAARWSRPSEYQDTHKNWVSNLSQLVTRIRELDLAVMIIADIPGYEYEVPQCIARHRDKACNRSKSTVDAERSPSISALKNIVAQNTLVHLVDPIELLCDQNECRIAQGGTVLYSDRQHLSVRGSREIAPMLLLAFKQLSDDLHQESRTAIRKRDQK
jgi:peptidoglycan/LPS O-acetylase OafA/YrhL